MTLVSSYSHKSRPPKAASARGSAQSVYGASCKTGGDWHARGERDGFEAMPGRFIALLRSYCRNAPTQLPLFVLRLGGFPCQSFAPQPFKIFVARPLLLLIFSQRLVVSRTKRALCLIVGWGVVLFVSHDSTFKISKNAGNGCARLAGNVHAVGCISHR